MRKLFFIEDSLTNKISYYHLLLLLASLPFDYFYSHLIVISFTVHTLINFKKGAVKPLFVSRTFLLQSVFLITLIGTVFTSYKNQAFDQLGRQIVIFIFPVLFCINPLDIKKYRPQLLLGFALICTLTICYLYADALRLIRYYHLPLKTLFSRAFTNHNFSDPIGMHATFFSFQVGIALVFLLSSIIKEKQTLPKLFYTICCTVLVAGLIQLSSKSILAVMFLAINFALPFLLLTGRKRLVFLTTGVVISLIAISVLFRSDAFKERFYRSLTEDLSPKPADDVTDSRRARWGVVMQLIKQAPVTGHGEGSELPLLHDSFYQHKLYNSFLNNLNSHNQYLSFLLKSGIGALLIYLLTLAYGFKISYQNKDLLFFTFMLLIAVVSLSENVFDVDKGTMFYGLFYSFFIFSTTNKKEMQQPVFKPNKKEIYFTTRATDRVISPC